MDTLAALWKPKKTPRFTGGLLILPFNMV